MAPSSVWEDGALRINPPEYQFGKYYKRALLVKQLHCLVFTHQFDMFDLVLEEK